jgi:glycosyltransferase involved in cell wall biosynthesis
LPFLKILHSGIKNNTKFPHELIVHDNGSNDDTLKWLQQNNIKHSHSPTNEGVAAVNYAVKQAKYPYIIDINADMYPLPGWDMEIVKQIQKFKKQKIDKFTISSCLIEPMGANHEYAHCNAGHSPETFNSEKLLRMCSQNPKEWARKNTTQYSHPITMPKALWDEFGGVDMEYEYGVGTDHDIAASAYSVGCRDFIMLGSSRVYHFVSQTIRKLPTNRSDGMERFKNKWGVTVDQFRQRMEVSFPYVRVEDGIL